MTANFPTTFSADGWSARWTDWDGAEPQTLSLRWENEAWTATGRVTEHDIDYVLRISPAWQVRQFMLFRDLDEPDLWLGTDGGGRWGEVNGAHRTELDGAFDIVVACSPFPHTVPVRRLPLEIGHAAEVTVLDIDVETLGIVPVAATYERISRQSWRFATKTAVVEFDVDEHGAPIDVRDRFRRSHSVDGELREV